jgi:Beta-ketoacyl synthase, N-terminal domain
VKPIGSPRARPADQAVCCAVAAHGVIEADSQAVAALRTAPSPPGVPALPANFLKHADEQTVVGLFAVFQAIQNHGLADEDFADWAVIAAPRFFGRAILAAALRRFSLEGAWGVSPHLIPHRSQHSLSGTISQALGIHGPNLGVGGGPSSASEVALVAASFVAKEEVPGLWVVLTAWDPEPTFSDVAATSRNGLSSPTPSTCKGVALALRAGDPADSGITIRVCPADRHGTSNGNGNGRHSRLSVFSGESLLEALARPSSAAIAWRLGASGWIEMDGLAREARELK